MFRLSLDSNYLAIHVKSSPPHLVFLSQLGKLLPFHSASPSSYALPQLALPLSQLTRVPSTHYLQTAYLPRGLHSNRHLPLQDYYFQYSHCFATPASLSYFHYFLVTFQQFSVIIAISLRSCLSCAITHLIITSANRLYPIVSQRHLHTIK